MRYGIAIELHDDRTINVLTEFTGDRECVIECFSADLLSRIIQIIVMTASKVKSQSSAVRASAVAKNNIKSGNSAHAEVKQQVKLTLDEVDNWEW